HHRTRRRGRLPGGAQDPGPRNPRRTPPHLTGLHQARHRLRTGLRRTRGGTHPRRPRTGEPRPTHCPAQRPRRRGERPMSTSTQQRPEERTGPDTPRTDPEHDASVNLSPVQSGALNTIGRGLELSPEFTKGLWLTLLFALVATAGKVIVPIAVQQITDNGIAGPGGPDLGFVTTMVITCAVLLVITMICSFLMNLRLYRATESGLATLRRKAFRHVHDLSVLTQNSERKDALVSRVTADVDQISTFMQWGGLQLLVSSGQLLVATALLAFYSWQLTLVVWVCFLPLLFGARWLQKLLSKAYLKVRECTGAMLGVVGETVMGAAVIRAHGIEQRTADRIDTTVLATRTAQVRAQRLSMAVSPFAEIVAAIGNTAVVLVGVWI